MLTIGKLAPADLPWATRLQDLAGWNQTEADWHRALQLEPTGCFSGYWNEAPAATLTTCIFGEVAWIAMVLTDPEFRGRGIAAALVRHALEYLETRGVGTVRLDATDLGRPVYEKFGFTVDYELHRWSGRPNLNFPTPDASGLIIGPARPENAAQMIDLDYQSCATYRDKLLLSYLKSAEVSGWLVHQNEVFAGFGMIRKGKNASQIGPVIAITAKTAIRLFQVILGTNANRPCYVDMPNSRQMGCELLKQAGLSIQRKFFRMTRGPKLLEKNEMIWASGGPEKG